MCLSVGVCSVHPMSHYRSYNFFWEIWEIEDFEVQSTHIYVQDSRWKRQLCDMVSYQATGSHQLIWSTTILKYDVQPGLIWIHTLMLSECCSRNPLFLNDFVFQYSTSLMTGNLHFYKSIDSSTKSLWNQSLIHYTAYNWHSGSTLNL